MLAKTLVWVVAIVVVGAGAAGIGYLVGHASSSSSPSAVANDTLSILGAGSLTGQFPRLASLLANETPGITAPAAAQDYEGSLDIVNAFTTTDAKADVAALADFRLIPQLLEPKYAGYEIVFGHTPEVLAYNPAIAAFDGINSENWGTKLVAAIDGGAAPFGYWNASTDPNGYNEIFSMELQGQLYGDSNVSIFSHFYTGNPWGLAKGVGLPYDVLEHESDAAELLGAGTVSAVITYRSYAVANHLTFVSFNQTVGLNASTSTALATYQALSTTILSSSDTPVHVHAAPILFAVTVPNAAYSQNPTLGAAFVHLLLSPQGSAILSQGGAFTPIFPGWLQSAPGNPTPLPPVLAPDVVPLPGWASAILT